MVRLPWSYSFKAQPGDYLYLSAKPDDIVNPDCEFHQQIALYASGDYSELLLTIKKDNKILVQGITCINYDPNTDLACESHEISATL